MGLTTLQAWLALGGAIVVWVTYVWANARMNSPAVAWLACLVGAPLSSGLVVASLSVLFAKG